MTISKTTIQAGAGALVQRIRLVFAGYEFYIPTDPAADDPTIPYPQLVVALALQVAQLNQVLDDIIVATRRHDVAQLRTELVALAGLDADAAVRAELVIDAVEQLQRVHDIILDARLAAVKAAHAEAREGQGEGA